jgi:PEP-CTERM motif-containing protein
MLLLKTAVLVVALTLIPLSLDATNIILNGDFEDNTSVGTSFNLPNATYNGLLANSTAFGLGNEIDLVTGSDLEIPPQSGSWKLGLRDAPSGSDAFSLTLSTPMVLGNNYALQFFGANTNGIPPAQFEIGVSTTADSFGVLVDSFSPTTIDTWTQFDRAFVAPAGGSFLTVLIPFSYGYVDNFTLDDYSSSEVPEPSTAVLVAAGLGALALFRQRRS